MKNLIIDATNEKIFFSIITESQSYTTTHVNSRENFDKFINLLLDFFKENEIKLEDVKNIFINRGPGKFSGIRNSIAVAKALAFTNKLNLYGFNSNDIKGANYMDIVDLYKKGVLIKNLIKPNYSS